MTAMILAAGRGERLRPLTDATPKALVEVGGRPLIEWHLLRLAEAGVSSVVINVDWLGEQIIERLGDGRRYGINIVYSPEFGNVLETAGGIQKALPMLSSAPFWVINADVFTDWQLPAKAPPGAAHLVLVPTPSFKQQGDFALHGGLVHNAGEELLTFSGIAHYRPEFFADLKPGRAPLAPLLRAAADEHALTGELHSGAWNDVGTEARLQEVREQYPSGPAA